MTDKFEEWLIRGIINFGIHEDNPRTKADDRYLQGKFDERSLILLKYNEFLKEQNPKICKICHTPLPQVKGGLEHHLKKECLIAEAIGNKKYINSPCECAMCFDKRIGEARGIKHDR